MTGQLILHQLFKIFKMKLNLIFLSLFVVEIIQAQVLPQALIVNNNTYPTTISANASFDLTPKNRNFDPPYDLPLPHILSDFTFSFNQNTPYTLQFLVKGKSFTKNYGFGIVTVVRTGIFLAFAPDANLQDDYSNTFINYFISPGEIHRYNRPTFEENYIVMNTNFGETYQITSTYDGTNFKEYINGVLYQTIAKPTNATWQTDPLHLVLGNNIDFSPVVFDEVRFWNKALDANEITKNWNKTLLGSEEGLQVYYTFDNQGYANELNTRIGFINDKSPNNNKATIAACDRDGTAQNFVTDIGSSSIPEGEVLTLDANNLDSYPGNGHGFSGNNSKYAYLWHHPFSLTNLIFYNSLNYNINSAPILNADGGRSLIIKNMYGKTNNLSNISARTNRSIETWVKFNDLNNNSVVSMGNEADNDLFEMVADNNKLLLNIGASLSSNLNIKSNRTIATNTWYHVVITWSPNIGVKSSNTYGAFRIYINGVKENDYFISHLDGKDNIDLASFNTTNTNIYVGNSLRSFNGKLGILNVYAIELSANEILNKYNTTKSRFGY
jgi:hypothetical protein